MRLAVMALAVTLALFNPAAADEWEDAKGAYEAGDFSSAISIMEPLAGAGNVEAQDTLSHIYWYGDGVPVDYDRALYWTKRAIKLGSWRAMFDLSGHYLTGRAVPKDETLGREWMERAAALDDPLAHFNLFIMKSAARDGSIEKDEAIVHLETSAELGHPAGLVALGYAYMTGDLGFPVSLKTAIKYLTQAADRRWIEALTVGGELLSRSGEQADYLRSAIYLRAALADGCYGVYDQLTFMLMALPSEDLLGFDAAFAEWLAAHPRLQPHSHRALPEACAIMNAGTPTKF